MSSRIEKIITRQKHRIEEGQFYEAHQQLRVIASRYLKADDYNAAIDVLSSGASLLLNAGQGGSGGDLCIFLMEVYEKAAMKPDAASKGRLLGLLRAFPEGEPTRKRFVGEMISWSVKHGEYPAGDPELHHVAGQIFADEGDVYDAERHLALGTKDSAQYLARLEYEWYSQDEPSMAAQYAARGVFPFLLIGNLRAANQFFLLFRSRLEQAGRGLNVQEVTSTSSDVRIYPSIPLLNFLSMLLLAVQRTDAAMFRQLKSHYAAQIKEIGAWDEALEGVAEMYFGIKKPRQSNPLLDMMGGLFGGTPGRASPKPQSQPAPPPAVD